MLVIGQESRSAAAQRLAPLLWALLAMFIFRVAGQIVVVLYSPIWLPPMQEWYSGLLPYPLLLPAQIALIAVMVKICADFSRGGGWSVQPRRWLGQPALIFGYIYFAAMVVRYGLRMWLVPEARWFGGTIPIFFHFVLAAFVIAVGLFHVRQR